MAAGRWLVGMELARARAAADPSGRAAALASAGDAYERARRPAGSGEAARPGPSETFWRGLGRGVAALLAPAPGLRHALERRLLGESR